MVILVCSPGKLLPYGIILEIGSDWMLQEEPSFEVRTVLST